MNLTNISEPVPLTADAEGVIRVGGTRITLDIVITSFNEGATPEEIVARYPTLPLADVYAVISCYLRKRPEIEAYLSQRGRVSQEVRRQNEARFDFRGVRERLLARQTGRQ